MIDGFNSFGTARKLLIFVRGSGDKGMKYFTGLDQRLTNDFSVLPRGQTTSKLGYDFLSKDY